MSLLCDDIIGILLIFAVLLGYELGRLFERRTWKTIYTKKQVKKK